MRRVGADEALHPGAFTLLDVRAEALFAGGHLAGSGQLARAELLERRAELPPRDQPVLVVADDTHEAAAAAAELEAMGYAGVAWLDVPLGRLPGGHADRAAAARMWRPAPYLEAVLPQLAPPGAPHPGPAADLAAGSGREAVFLALHGFDVEAWDRAPEALERATALARRHGVSIRPVIANLEWTDPAPALEPGRYTLITVFRFLHRPLFPIIERALAPGGWLVYETYRTGQERYGRPKSPKFLLATGELARAFPGLAVVHADEPESAEGPITARLLARKPLV